MGTINYFAYGSNMSCRRLKHKDRVPSAKVIGSALFDCHCLKFHKVSSDGSAKCDIVHSESNNVYGVLFEIDAEEERRLDCVEGLHKGYEKKHVAVKLVTSGNVLSAKTYYATKICSDLNPYTWHREHVLRGAAEARLPQSYIKTFIKDVPVDPDPCKKREAKELKIYRSRSCG